jgi:serine/threonine protein kinase/tetratricopeptide (TPR) repeat protein
MSDETTPPPDRDSEWTALPPDSNHPERIGPYRILQKIGEGGMGEVYEALQEEPVRRKVALKVIKAGMDTKQVVARFEAERQALALMDHPGVAKVFDAGSTERGRPYFVLEHVSGVPITEYCDRHKLSNHERLLLFTQVCEGVQHAHQKGVIHRDLKPSNVLVAIQEDKPVPKIIDFGVAKATAQRLTEKTLFTELGVLIGTPEYMSPEQAEMTTEDVDTRTDVYALGVMLYELLTGALPFDPKELRSGGFEGIRQKIREEDPTKPSARLSTLGDERSQKSAASRNIDLPALRSQLKGDLDWIVMRALEKDRTRRYGSPSELAADVRRHLGHEPVLAGPPSTLYRARKFVRRHRIGVGVAAVGVTVLAVFALTMAVQAARIAAERDRANSEREASDRVAEFLVGLFEVSDPSEARGSTITAREILDSGAREIYEGLAGQPELQARLMTTVGEVYHKLGLYSQAEPLLEQALETRRSLLDDEHPDTLGSMHALAYLYWLQGRYDEAERLCLETLESQKRILGADHPNTLESMNTLVALYKYRKRNDEAVALCLETIEAQKRVLGADHRETLTSMSNLALLYSDMGQFDKAEPLCLETLETRKRVLGTDHPETLTSMNRLAHLYLGQGRYDEAEPLLLETLAIRKRVFGESHPDTAISLYNMGCLEAQRGNREEALDWLRRATDAGFAFANWMANDYHLESLHGPEFDALVARARENVATRRAE